MLRWIYERFSFWNLACHACGSRDGWRTSFCGWRINSYIAAVACRQCGAEQFLKKYRQAAPVDTNCLAQWEYEVLRYLDGAGSAPLFLLPRVYNFAATTCALSMEYLKGENMDEKMRRAIDRKDFDECLRASAAWLQGLHGLPALRDKIGANSATMLLRLEFDCAPLAGRSVLVARALTYMRSSVDRVSSLPVELVPLHGDFKASNLISTQSGVYGIDVGMRFKNPGVMDAAQFVANVLLNRRDIAAIAGDCDADSIVGVFLEAYGDNSDKNCKLMAWWLLYFLLSRWEEDLKSWKPPMIVDRSYATALAGVLALCDENDAAIVA